MAKTKPYETSYVYTSDSDFKTQCPACFTDDTSRVGDVFIDGVKQPLHKCNSCNATYTKPHGDGGLQELADIIQAKYKAEDVSIVAADGTGVTFNGSGNLTVSNVTDAMNELDTNLDWESKDKLDQIIRNTDSLQQVAQNTTNLMNLSSDISFLTSSIETLMSKLENLAVKNSELAERLATDPLINIREKINKFNLE